MQDAIRIDPETGLKRFATRASQASDKIRGQGYSLVADESLKELPPERPGAVFNAQEQAKYREFKEARAGAADYMAMEGEFSRYLDDVYSAEPIPREALTDECEILVVGAGFADCCCGTNYRRRDSKMCVFVRKAAMLGGPGTGIAIQESPAT